MSHCSRDSSPVSLSGDDTFSMNKMKRTTKETASTEASGPQRRNVGRLPLNSLLVSHRRVVVGPFSFSTQTYEKTNKWPSKPDNAKSEDKDTAEAPTSCFGVTLLIWIVNKDMQVILSLPLKSLFAPWICFWQLTKLATLPLRCG
ncbi:hypothetical protein BHM03_00025732 [Ensete ventricosum]|uniref:Uncharacterized protein n=1 Tax=Ensete ventricosum TaxID=4639 RepID=A0A445MH22_ENSVE|nr:hypothetical protein BHM03_00025732 [Ensete ventricosum]